MSQALAPKKPAQQAKQKKAAKVKIDHPKYVSYENLDAAGEAALFYGFTPLATPHIHPEDSSEARKISSCEVVVDQDNHEEGASVRLEEKIALLRLYEKEKLHTLPQPLMLYYKKPFVGDRRKQSGKEHHHGLEIIGTTKPIAEAMLVQAALAILSDSGEEGLRVEVNSMGDKESTARFTRELTAYYRKHLAELPQKCRETLKTDVYSLLGCEHEACRRLAENCPRSINFLSEKSRLHFKEVLELLEALDVPYMVNNALVANRDFCSETVFEIRSSEPGSHPLAIGIRYDTLAKRLGHKKDLPAIGVSIAVRKKAKGASVPVKLSTVAKILEPQVCFMQLGFEAKSKSLRLIESLRQARVPIVHSLAKDKMAGQVGMAEKTQAPTVVIMGKKEAMEDAVIIRDSATRSQETVPIAEAAAKLKKYKV